MAKMRVEHAALQTRSLEEILIEHSRLLDVMHVEVLAGRLSQEQARIDRMRGIFAFCDVDVSEEAGIKAAAAHAQRYRAARRAVPGARELLERLRPHVKVIIVTNNLLAEQQSKLECCGLTDLVDALITSEEFGCAKPDPAIFQIALDRAACTSKEAVMIGDSWPIDILGAVNCGIRAVWFNRHGLKRPGDEATEITSLSTVHFEWITMLPPPKGWEPLS